MNSSSCVESQTANMKTSVRHGIPNCEHFSPNRSRSPPGLSPASAASVSSAGAVSGAPAALVPPIFTIAEDDDDLIAADRGGFQSPVKLLSTHKIGKAAHTFLKAEFLICICHSAIVVNEA